MTSEHIEDRIKSFRRVKASDLRPNPKNWRTHPQEQRDGLQTMLERVGYADAVIARETPQGLMLVDGHLRTEESDPDAMIPTLIVDLTEDEADLVLSTLDPLAAMAGTDVDAFASLLRTASGEDDTELSILFEDIADSAGVSLVALAESETNADFVDYDSVGGQTMYEGHVPNDMRAIILHVTEEEHAAFYQRAFELGEAWQIENLAAVVVKAVETAHAECPTIPSPTMVRQQLGSIE